MSSKRLKNRIAIVTGASRGIGRAVATRYAVEGAKLVILARTTGALEELDDEIWRETGKRSLLVPIDLKDGELIDQLGEALYKRFGLIDILVGNAAMLGGLQPIGHYSPDKWDEVIALNLTANWRLIRSLDPLLRLSLAGRAIFVSSGITEGIAKPFWGVYASSKAGLEALARSYAAETKRTNVKVNIIDPGIVATNMRSEAYPGENPETLCNPVDVTEKFVELAEIKFQKSGIKYFAQ